MIGDHSERTVLVECTKASRRLPCGARTSTSVSAHDSLILRNGLSRLCGTRRLLSELASATMPPRASTSNAGAAAASAKKLSPVELKLLNAGLAVKGGVRAPVHSRF